MAWQNGARKQISKIMTTIRAAIEKICPRYFEAWDRMVCEEHNTYELEPPDDIELVLKLQTYLRSHETDRRELRDAVPEADRFMLTAHEVAMVQELDVHVPDLRNMSWHLQLKATVDSLWRSAWTFPAGDTAYACWDHMAPNTCKHI